VIAASGTVGRLRGRLLAFADAGACVTNQTRLYPESFRHQRIEDSFAADGDPSRGCDLSGRPFMDQKQVGPKRLSNQNGCGVAGIESGSSSARRDNRRVGKRRGTTSMLPFMLTLDDFARLSRAVL
jgi:hypothetical protein